MTMKGYYNILI